MAKKYTELSKEEEQRMIDLHKKAIVINVLSTFPTKDIGNTIANFQK